jgi:hypothetical protein
MKIMQRMKTEMIRWSARSIMASVLKHDKQKSIAEKVSSRCRGLEIDFSCGCWNLERKIHGEIVDGLFVVHDDKAFVLRRSRQGDDMRSVTSAKLSEILV